MGKFSAERMHISLTAFADLLGVDATEARTLHMSNSAVYALPNSGIVLRITRSTKLHKRVHKVARLGRWFNSIEAPTIRLTSGLTQPLVHEGLLATVWDYIPPSSPPPTANDLGETLKKIHSLDVTGVDIPYWDPVGIARKRIADAEDLDAADRTTLLDWCDRLAPKVDTLNASTLKTLVHGDAHIGNLLRRSDGQVVLCDFDSTCKGPQGVDVAAAAAAAIWFKHHDTHDQLVDSYGYDITTDPAWPTLREARELAYVVSGVPLMASTPGIAEQFRLRLESVMKTDTSITWTPYAHFANTR